MSGIPYDIGAIPTPNTHQRLLKASGSKLEAKFQRLWWALDGPKLEREVKFHPTRKWRLDFAEMQMGKKVGIEISGGIWVKSKHSSGTGIMRDAEKNREAIFMGWDVFTLTPSDIKADLLRRIIQFIKEKTTP